MKFHLTLIVAFLFLLTNCKTVPKTKYAQWKQKIEYDVNNDSLIIKFNNPLHCPLRISAKSTNTVVQEKISLDFPIILASKVDTVLRYWTDQLKEEIPIQFTATLGNPNDSIIKKNINLPFNKGKTFKIIQGYNGTYSHSSAYSKYAIDFNLAVGDTICAAADGVVVGVIEGYINGGKSKKWRDYANYITAFHPEMNLYTQYVHLTHNGSLVEVGDFVVAEQAIALSGKTGYTDIEHLHFNVLKASAIGMQSTPINFKEGYSGAELKRGVVVKK